MKIQLHHRRRKMNYIHYELNAFFFPMKIRGYENNSCLLNLYFACINRCTRLEIIIIINPRLEQINVYNVSCSRKQ